MVQVITAAVPFFLKLALLYLRSLLTIPAPKLRLHGSGSTATTPAYLLQPRRLLSDLQREEATTAGTAHIILHDAGGPSLPSAKVS
jgi:hypothetical protein